MADVITKPWEEATGKGFVPTKVNKKRVRGEYFMYRYYNEKIVNFGKISLYPIRIT